MAESPLFGRVTVEFTRGPLVGRTLSARSEVKVKAFGGKVESTTALDETVTRSFEPGTIRIDMTFARDKLGMSQSEMLAHHDVIVTEVDFGRAHHIVDGFFTGDPEESAKSGDFSGLVLECGRRDYFVRSVG